MSYRDHGWKRRLPITSRRKQYARREESNTSRADQTHRSIRRFYTEYTGRTHLLVTRWSRGVGGADL